MTAAFNRRAFLAGGAAALLAATSPPPPVLRIQRLAWAGIRLSFGDAALFIDPLVNPEVWGRSLPDALIPITPASENFVLISHRHPDHFDPLAVRAALANGGLLVYPGHSGPMQLDGVRTRAAPLHEPMLLGEFTATAVPAADGYGDPQASWIVNVGGRRILHAGDTLWHGGWWHIGRQHRPFDAVFLPVNGARFSWRQPVSEIPAVLTPEQAVAAAVILGARRLVPIHYGVVGADGYAEVEQPLTELRRVAARRNIRVDVLRPGESLSFD